MRSVPTASAVLASGELVELVYDRRENKTQFVCGRGNEWRYENELIVRTGERLVPFSATNNLLVHDVVLLPEEPVEYGTAGDLFAKIRAFVHKYVDLSDLFEELTAYYVLLTWIYDNFEELPYLRVRGDYGSGKTRFLLVVGSICYKPMFASGASTTSPLFRIIDAFRGTLVLDESDFRVSDERTEIVKILNNGNSRGFPVLRTEVLKSKEFDPRAYTVFGPKIVATRGYFDDRALESRCLTEDLGQRALREDIPINLSPSYRREALELRNRLLLYRLRNFQPDSVPSTLSDRKIEPRLRQIFAPFLSLIDDDETRGRASDLLRAYQRDMVSDRALAVEARVLESIEGLRRIPGSPITIAQIASEMVRRFGEEFERPVTAKWVGAILRRRLGLKPIKSHGNFILERQEIAKLPQLYAKFGVEEREASSDVVSVEEHSLP